MATDVGERIAKLLRLASPKSGSTEAERASAALEAAKLFGEFELQIVPVPPKRSKRFPTDQPPPQQPPPSRQPASRPATSALDFFGINLRDNRPRYSPTDWTAAVVDGDTVCVVCGSRIDEGEEAWFSGAYNRYRCYDITCSNG
jgi:hypothetical protein